VLASVLGLVLVLVLAPAWGLVLVLVLAPAWVLGLVLGLALAWVPELEAVSVSELAQVSVRVWHWVLCQVQLCPPHRRRKLAMYYTVSGSVWRVEG
jgi:hypothetical protein